MQNCLTESKDTVNDTLTNMEQNLVDDVAKITKSLPILPMIVVGIIFLLLSVWAIKNLLNWSYYCLDTLKPTLKTKLKNIHGKRSKRR